MIYVVNTSSTVLLSDVAATVDHTAMWFSLTLDVVMHLYGYDPSCVCWGQSAVAAILICFVSWNNPVDFIQLSFIQTDKQTNAVTWSDLS